MGDTSLMASDGPESVFRSVADAEVSLDEMLSLACRQGKQDIVELLLESGAKVNYRNKAGNTPLLEACSQGHVAIACLLLERNADIDAPTETTSDSALTWACTLGNEEIVQLLLEHRASIEHRTRDGCTALMFAALAGHENVARLLLEHGAKLNVESDSNKDSPLTFACWKGHQRVVELFLAHKANIEHRTKEGFSPLMFAALGGHTEVARLLLEKKAEVNNPSGSNNDIPLTSACWKGHHAVVELLLQYNSNIEHHTKDGCTPLMLAAREGHLSVAQLLLNHNAKVNVPSGSENNIPLTLACWKGHRDVVELLLHYNSNIEHQNKAGCTPLMLAAREGHFEATELLLDHHAHLNVPSGSNDDTPLTLACWKGHEGVVSLLLEKLSSINHQTKTGCTPLMEATREGHVGVAKMLLEAGADVETPDNYGQTPFFMACWKGHAEVASMLLDYGANKDCRTKTGITPFFQACRENHVAVVKLLLDYGCNPSSPFPNSRECPLTLAAEKGFAELTQVLISRNANVECRTKKGCTPFFLTCKEGFQEIAVMLVKHGADTEATDQRGVTPLLAAFRNGHVEVVDWLLGHVAHLPSDLDCQKALMAPKASEKEVLPQRSKCLELIMKAKKAREQAALKNAQSLFDELEAEREKKESKKKAAARKRTKRKEKKKKEQAEKNAETECDAKDEEDDEEDEEEEELTTRPNPQVEYSQTTNERDQLPALSPAPVRKRSKRKGKKNTSSNENGLATPTSGSTTAASRTSLQTPAHLVAESWEDEESGDEVFVDAPSEFLPDGTGFQGSGKDLESSETGKKPPPGKTSRDQKVDGDDKTGSSCGSKLAKQICGKNQKAKSNKEEVKSPAPVKRSNSRKATNAPDAPPVSEVPPRSPGEKKRKTGGNKSPDPSTTVDKKKSEMARKQSPGLGREDEEDYWDNELEPSLDWSNDQQQPFVSKQVNRTKSWSAVTTATSGVSTATSSTLLNSNVTSSKNWQEVSRAIKTHQLTVSNSLVGRIIGRKGMKINQIQADSGAQISISRAIPRSVDRLVTIKGTERSVNTARELIEEALSTSSRDSEDTVLQSTSQTTPPLISTTPSQTTSTLATTGSVTSSSPAPPPHVNPWHQTTSVWGQKRYSEVVPITTNMVQQSESTVLTTSTATTTSSTAVTTAVTLIQKLSVSTSGTTQAPPLVQSVETHPKIATPSDEKSEVVAVTTAVLTRNGSVPVSSLSSLKEDEFDTEEVLKHKRSNSEPSNPSMAKGVCHSSASSLSRHTPPLTLPSVSAGLKYSPSMSPIFSPSESEPGSKTISSTLSDISLHSTESETPKAVATTTTTAPSSVAVGVTRSTRMVGVVTPTQTVKPYQREATPTQTLSSTASITLSSSSNNCSPSVGAFGAIGPPTSSRRNSLPVAPVSNNFDVNDLNSRKFSYAGIPMVQPVGGGSLGVVHESFPLPQREYSWPPPLPPPPPPHGIHTPSYMPPPPNHVDWSGGNLAEHERGRSQSWAGLPPGNFRPPHDFPLGGNRSSYHYDNQSNDHIPHVHSHTSWGGVAKGPYHHQNPAHSLRPAYQFRPHSNVYSQHPPVARNMNAASGSGNYGNSALNHFDLGQNAHQQHDGFRGNWAPPPGYHKPAQSGNEPLSLRQVLGEKLEQEIFPGDSTIPSVDFKDDSPLSKRWSVSSFPPQISTGPGNITNGTSTSTWGTHHQSGRHSVTVSPFQQGDTAISDLAASWPIWSSPIGGSAHQPQSPFSPSSSLPSGVTEDGWTSVSGAGVASSSTHSDLVELMKSLDIAEHIPALKNRKLSVEQLCNMSEDEWRDLNLPVGPRVKLMNAIHPKPQEKLATASSKSSNLSDGYSDPSFLQVGGSSSSDKGSADQLSQISSTSYVK